MDIKGLVQGFIPEMDSPERVYKLFPGLGYPEDKVLDPTYKRKIEEFELAKEEREKVKEIYTVFNYDGKLQIFLIKTTTLPTSLVRYLAKCFSDRYHRFLLILTTDYKEYTFVFPEVVEYLSNHLTDLSAVAQAGLPKEWIYRLLFDENKQNIEEYITKNKLWYRLEEVLDNLAVVDPACGSGAFLVGMLQVLVELYRLTYSNIKREMTEFELKKKIIGNSLLIEKHFEFIESRIDKKSNIEYSSNTYLIIPLFPDTLIMHDEWIEIVRRLASIENIFSKFCGLFIYDEISKRMVLI